MFCFMIRWDYSANKILFVFCCDTEVPHITRDLITNCLHVCVSRCNDSFKFRLWSYRYEGITVCVRSLRFTSLQLSLTSFAPTMRHPPLALSRRSWSMRSTVRGGPSFWPCAGLTRTHTCYRRSLLLSHSLR